MKTPYCLIEVKHPGGLIRWVDGMGDSYETTPSPVGAWALNWREATQRAERVQEQYKSSGCEVFIVLRSQAIKQFNRLQKSRHENPTSTKN